MSLPNFSNLGAVVIALTAAVFLAFSVNFASLSYVAGASVFLVLVPRFLLFLVLGLSLYQAPIKNIKKGDWIWLAVISIGMTTQNFSYMSALQYLPVSIAVILLYTFPIFTYFVSALINKESLSVKHLIWLCIGFAGVFLIVFRGETQWSYIGLFLGLLSAVATSFINVSIAKIPHINNWQMLKFVAILPLMLFSGFFISQKINFSTISITWVVLSAIGFCVGMILYFTSIKKIGANRTSNLMYFEPVFAVIVSMMIFSDSLQLIQWLGILIVLIAAFFFEKKLRKV